MSHTRANTHQCEGMPEKGISVELDRGLFDKGDQKVWCLVIRREATEQDLEENHHLEEEGQTLWTTALEITHCPFCGKNLTVELDTPDQRRHDFGQFVHIDSSGWSSRIC